MGKTTAHIEKFFHDAGEYLETKTEIWKLKLADKASDAISGTVTVIVLSIIGFLFILMISIGAAIWLGEVTGQLYCGFLLVGLFYALIAIIFYIFRERWLKVPVANKMLRKFFK